MASRRVARAVMSDEPWATDSSSASKYTPEDDNSGNSDSDGEELESLEELMSDEETGPGQDTGGRISETAIDSDDDMEDLADIDEQVEGLEVKSSLGTGDELNDELDDEFDHEANDQLNARDPDALFDGNLHPPEFYQSGIKSMDLEDYTVIDERSTPKALKSSSPILRTNGDRTYTPVD